MLHALTGDQYACAINQKQKTGWWDILVGKVNQSTLINIS